MNGFHAEPRRGRWGLRLPAVLLGCVLIPVAAAAQSDGPIRLTPPPTSPFQAPEVAPERRFEVPRPRSPASPGTATGVDRVPLPEAGGRGTAVEVQPLGRSAGGAVGVLDDGAGLGSDLWRGSGAAEIEDLLRDLPLSSLGRDLSALLQRLLLTRAPIEGSGEEEARLAELRARVLVRLGNTEGARRLATAIGDADLDGMSSRARIDALLVENEKEEACGAARRGVEADFDVYAQRVLIFCQIAAGERDRAGIGLNVLREAAESDDPLFVALAETLLGYGRLPAQAPERLEPLHFAMWRATGDPVPDGLWRSADPGIWRALAAAADAPVAERIEAAELAVAAGALPGETLADLYRLVEGAAGERERLAAEEPTTWSGRERALLFQNATAAIAPAERAATLQRLFELARARGGYAAAVLASVALTAELEPSARLTFFAVHAGRAHLVADDLESAEKWAALAWREREVNPYAARDVAALAPLLTLAGGGEGGRLSEEAFDGWWRRALEAGAEAAPEKGSLILDLLEALGEPVPSSAGLPLRRGSTGGGAAMSPAGRLLAAAVAEGGRGKVVLAVAHLLGTPEARGDLAVVPLAIRGLRLAGLEEDARRLAIAAAIDAGI